MMLSNHIHFDTVDSTHKYAMENGLNLPDKTLITADHQTSGRGRLGRNWVSGNKQSILASMVLKPDVSASAASQISHVLALAICDSLEAWNLNAEIKWPNDILVGGKKIAGVLSEASLGDKLEFVVLSFGLNSRQTESDLVQIDKPATSLFNELRKHPNTQVVLREILRTFNKLYAEFIESGFQNIVNRWRKKMALYQKEVLIDIGESVMQGRVVEFENDGSITILTPTSQKVNLTVGEVIRVLDSERNAHAI